jgi:hypothetical protein
MEDYIKEIETKLYGLMETEDIPQTVVSLGEELRLEYPELFKTFAVKTAEKYSIVGCGQHHVHINGLLTILDRWAEEGKVEKTLKEGNIYWRKTNQVIR